LIIPAVLFVPRIYAALRGGIVYILLAAVVVLILRERRVKRIFSASIIFLISGAFGYVALNQDVVSTTQILFPVFVGLFGLSNILYSLKSKTHAVPQQPYAALKADKKFISAGFAGSIGGMIVGILPAMSPSQVGLIIYEFLGANIQSFLVSVSAINTADAIFSLVSLYTIHNPRSGVATMIGEIIEINSDTLLLFLGTIAFSGLFATLLHLYIGRKALKLFGKINYRKVNAGALILVVALVYAVTGWFGLFVAGVATSIGLLPIFAKVSRTHVMGVLIVPTILYFLGVSS